MTEEVFGLTLYSNQAIDESARLYQIQEVYEKDLPTKFIGLSVNETILDLIRLGYNSRAAKIKSDFKVPEKRFWWLKLRGLVAKRDWGEIEEWSKTKKSPIGWEVRSNIQHLPICIITMESNQFTLILQPFFNECLAARNSKVAALFVPKCTHLPPADRMDMWVKCGMLAKAGEEALKVKDMNSLEALRARSKVQSETLELDRMINVLKSK